MATIGNSPTQQNFVAGGDQFSGNGTAITFSLSRNVNTVFDIFVTVSNVPQDPFTAYSVSANTITFTSAPPAGTNNIDVVYRATNVQTFVPTPGVSAQFGLGSAAAPSMTFIGNTTTGVFSPATNTLAFSTNGTEDARFDSSGNFGIGNTSPGAKLDVTGNIRLSAGSPNIEFNNGGGMIYGPAGNTLAFATGGGPASPIERMRIDSSGNVGIGTSSPSYQLSLQNSANFSIHLLKTSSNDGWIRNIGNLDIAAASGGATGQVISFSNGANYAGLTERARFDSSGNLLVNTTSMPGSSNNILGIVYKSGGNGAGIRHPDSTGGSAPKVFDFCNSSNSSVGYIAVSGTGVAFTSTSDYRLKENVQPMTGALEKVTQLKPCTYTWKSTGGAGQGFIAHELQAVVPDAVVGEKDAIDADGNPQYQGVDTSFLVATLTAAIQEQQAMIEELKAEVAALKGAV